ncbi:hypothetical protein CR513_09839, partial [Mucuna pruriens]
MSYDQAGKERKLPLQEQEELRLETYKNSHIYKQKPDLKEGVSSHPKSALVQFSLKAHRRSKPRTSWPKRSALAQKELSRPDMFLPSRAQLQSPCHSNKAYEFYHIHFTLLTLSLHSSVVHGASIRCLVDRGGACLESGKLEILRLLSVIFYSSSNTNPLVSEFNPTLSKAKSSLTLSEAESNPTLFEVESSPTLSESESSVSVRDRVRVFSV